MGEPDERGIDVAIMAFIGARLSGASEDEAKRNAEAMLDMFGLRGEHQSPTDTGGENA